MTATTVRVPESAERLMRDLAARPADDPARAGLRDQAIRGWLPLAQHLAARYRGRGEPTEDLVQTATIGLIKAIDRYDAERGTDFAAFAVPTVLGEIRRHFRDKTWAIRVPRRTQELRMSVTAAAATLTQRLGRSPTTADLAAHLSVSEEDVLEGLEAAYAYRTTSLAAPLHEDGSVELGDTLGMEDHDLEVAEFRIALKPAMASLSERERTILLLRFFGNLTQTEIAERIGISQMHVSRLITQALGTLRTQLNES